MRHYDTDYKRNGTSTLFAALDVFSGKVIAKCTKRYRHTEFLRFLKKVYKETPKRYRLAHNSGQLQYTQTQKS